MKATYAVHAFMSTLKQICMTEFKRNIGNTDVSVWYLKFRTCEE